MHTKPNSRDYVVALMTAADVISALDGSLFERTAREACLVAEAISEWDLFARALAQHAWALYRSGDIGQSLLRAEHAAHVARRLADSRELHKALYTIATVRGRIGDIHTASQIWTGLIGIANASADVLLEARGRMMYALLLCESDCSEEALIQGDAAFKLFSDLGDAMKALAANNMALAAIRASKYALAEYWLQLAEEACPSNSNLWRSYIVHTEGQLALATNRYADARAAFARALEVLPGERDDVSHTANLYLDIGRLHIVEGVAAKALASLDHALILAEDSGDAALVAKVHDALHDAYEKIGDFDSALRHCRKRGAALTRSAAAKSAEQIAVLKAAEALVHERAKWAAVRYSA